MDGMMNKNQLTMVKEYGFNTPLIQKLDSLIDNSVRDCQNKYFHTLDQICVYDLNFTNITNNESAKFTISDKNMGLYELNKKLAIARGNSFIFNHINKLTIKIYINLSNINIRYCLKLHIPMGHRLFLSILLKIKNIFKHIAMTEEIHFILHVANGFHIIIHNVIWYNYMNSYTNTKKIIRILV